MTLLHQVKFYKIYIKIREFAYEYVCLAHHTAVYDSRVECACDKVVSPPTFHMHMLEHSLVNVKIVHVSFT